MNEKIGSDGLTDKEREYYANQYIQKYATFTKESYIAAYRWAEEKRASS